MSEREKIHPTFIKKKRQLHVGIKYYREVLGTPFTHPTINDDDSIEDKFWVIIDMGGHTNEIFVEFKYCVPHELLDVYILSVPLLISNSEERKIKGC